MHDTMACLMKNGIQSLSPSFFFCHIDIRHSIMVYCSYGESCGMTLWHFYYIVALFLLAFLSWVAQVMKNWCIRPKRRKSFPHSGDVISPMSQKHCRNGHVSRIVKLVSWFGCRLCEFSASPAFRFCGNTDQMGWKKCDKPFHCQDPCLFRSKHILSNWPFWALSLFSNIWIWWSWGEDWRMEGVHRW